MNRAEYDAVERELLKARESLRKVQERTETIEKGKEREDGEGEN